MNWSKIRWNICTIQNMWEAPWGASTSNYKADKRTSLGPKGSQQCFFDTDTVDLTVFTLTLESDREKQLLIENQHFAFVMQHLKNINKQLMTLPSPFSVCCILAKKYTLFITLTRLSKPVLVSFEEFERINHCCTEKKSYDDLLLFICIHLQ